MFGQDGALGDAGTDNRVPPVLSYQFLVINEKKKMSRRCFLLPSEAIRVAAERRHLRAFLPAND
jgi:hypothetical protein